MEVSVGSGSGRSCTLFPASAAAPPLLFFEVAGSAGEFSGFGLAGISLSDRAAKLSRRASRCMELLGPSPRLPAPRRMLAGILLLIPLDTTFCSRLSAHSAQQAGELGVRNIR